MSNSDNEKNINDINKKLKELEDSGLDSAEKLNDYINYLDKKIEYFENKNKEHEDKENATDKSTNVENK